MVPAPQAESVWGTGRQRQPQQLDAAASADLDAFLGPPLADGAAPPLDVARCRVVVAYAMHQRTLTGKQTAAEKLAAAAELAAAKDAIVEDMAARLEAAKTLFTERRQAHDRERGYVAGGEAFVVPPNNRARPGPWCRRCSAAFFSPCCELSFCPACCNLKRGIWRRSCAVHEGCCCCCRLCSPAFLAGVLY